MSKNNIKTKIQMNQKKLKEFVRVLRYLAQSEDLITNRIKIIISKGEIIEEKNHIFIAPSKFKSYSEHSVEQNSTEKKSVNTIENSNVKNNISNPHYIGTVDYPDSSDLSDDE